MNHELNSRNRERGIDSGAGIWQLLSLLLCLAVVVSLLMPGQPAAENPRLPDAATAAPAVVAESTAAVEVDWSRIEVSPDPSPMSIGEYGL